ncbi:MAG TPA: polyketide cyclase [Thermoanaerobaculia bacterium]|nr:polyketide cyclase [Thermoanaerobaculia bacterium]
MGASEYHFVTRWRVVGTVDEVSDILSRPEGLVRWWPAVYLEVETLEPGDDAGVGKSVRVLSRGFLPYTLSWTFRVVESRRPLGFTIEAAGDLVGRGVWTFEQAGAWVDITYDWRVRAEKAGVKQLSPILKPVFAANHRWAMRQGEAGLREELARRRGAAGSEPIHAPPPPPRGSFPALWVWAAGFALGLLAVGLAYLRPRRRSWRLR